MIVAFNCFLGVTIQSAQNTTQTSTKAEPLKLTLTECEGVNNCATWRFIGSLGSGKWPDGSEGTLTKSANAKGEVLIHRVDTVGPSAGLTADYRGTLKDEGTKDMRLSGEVTSWWPGHWETKKGDWYAFAEIPHQGPPGVVRSCTIPDYRYCWTYTWNRDHYDGVVDNGPNTGILTVEGLNGEPVDLHPGQTVVTRLKQASPAYTSIGKGMISSQGNSIQNGQWSDSNGASGFFTSVWGTAINDLPVGKYPKAQVPVWEPSPLEIEIGERLLLHFIKTLDKD